MWKQELNNASKGVFNVQNCKLCSKKQNKNQKKVLPSEPPYTLLTLLCSFSVILTNIDNIFTQCRECFHAPSLHTHTPYCMKYLQH